MDGEFDPLTIALIGFGEAGSAIARGLAGDGGWRGAARPGDNRPRRVIAIDTALDADDRGRALGAHARRLGVPIAGGYTAALAEADLVLCAVPGESALDAATAAAPFLKPGALYLDLCTISGAMAADDRAAVEAGSARYVDVAVMGTFFGHGIRTPMILAGADAAAAAAWMNGNGFAVSVLGPKPGSASSVKLMRSVLIKGLEALAVESLVAAGRQGILEEVLACLGDVDKVPFRQFLTTLLETHIVHAGRRMEEMELVERTLAEIDVDPLMTRAIVASHRRTVDAGIKPADGRVPPFDVALALLADKVVGGR
ncbi:MAG: NAD(P)-dependent oxidoreductase [Rhodospirillales bacterium]|nr:MAG: NAD(P)-dependent oxidoreductase [Rhodospirillales bacterium]